MSKQQHPAEEIVSLSSLGAGALAELFDEEFSRVLENIQDRNTEPDATREITLKVTIKPQQDRSRAAVAMQAKSKLAPNRGAATTIHMGQLPGGKLVGVEHDPQQGILGIGFPENVHPITAEGEEAK